MKRIIIIALSLAIIIGGVWALGKSESQQSYKRAELTHPNSFFDSRYFNFSREPLQNAGASKTKVHGAVVPHHLLAYELIAEVFSQLKEDKPSVIILIGPNHDNEGEKILTSTWGWETPFGTVEANTEIIESLVKNSPVKINDGIFSTEHSMGALMPFIKYFFPEAQVVPIIFHYNLKDEEAQSLSDQLANIVKEKEALVMASIDFSHYLTNQEAQAKDQETLEIIRTKNIPRLLSLGDDYLDSPGALATLLYTMERLDINEPKILQNTNSGILMGNDLIETTSYITMIFGK